MPPAAGSRAGREALATTRTADSVRGLLTGLVIWDLAGTLPLPLGVGGHEGSTVLVGLNGLRLLRDAAWERAAADGTG